MHTHVYMQPGNGALAGATQNWIDPNGELNVYIVLVKVIKVYFCNL